MRNAPRILIVEDQHLIAASCEMILQSAGYECAGCAADARSAFELAKREQPDLILMDIHIDGEVNGIQVATEIYEQLGIHCIFVSGHAYLAMEPEGRRAQPVGWIDKPYNEECLVNAVQRGLQLVAGEKGAAADALKSDLHAAPLRQ